MSLGKPIDAIDPPTLHGVSMMPVFIHMVDVTRQKHVFSGLLTRDIKDAPAVKSVANAFDMLLPFIIDFLASHQTPAPRLRALTHFVRIVTLVTVPHVVALVTVAPSAAFTSLFSELIAGSIWRLSGSFPSRSRLW